MPQYMSLWLYSYQKKKKREFKKRCMRDIHSGPVVKNPPYSTGAQVRFLVQE